jgi:hypothetical protein
LLLNLLPIYDSFHEIINSEFYLGVNLSLFFNQVTDEDNATAYTRNNSVDISGKDW